MKLLILRHGRAEAYRADDASRQLVASGEADVRSVVTRQQARMGQPQQIWHSGYVRARDTAAIASDILGASIPVQVTETLVPEGRPQAVVDALYASGLESVLLVSHQPLVSSLLDTLCGPAGPEAHHMPTASLACVELEVAAAGLGELRWLARP